MASSRNYRTSLRFRKYINTEVIDIKKYCKGMDITLKLAYQCISGYGWYKNTNSWRIRQKLGIDEIVNKCKKIISYHAKLKRGVVHANSTVAQAV